MSDPAPGDLPPHLRVPEREVELLYSVGWWDGPLSGLARHDGRYFWFEFYCDDDDGKEYYYHLHPIPAAEQEAALAWFARYKDYQRRWLLVGNDPSTRNLPSTKALLDEWMAFGDSRFDYASRPWTGWFCSGENPAFYAIQVTRKEDG